MDATRTVAAPISEPAVTKMPDITRTPLDRIDNAARETVLQRVRDNSRRVPVASFQSAL